MKAIGIILLGGKGSRLNSDLPKQFIEVNGKMICEYALSTFQDSEYIAEICISYIDGYEHIMEKLKTKYDKIKYLVKGGIERQSSVYNALSSIEINKDTTVVIHDGARPLVTKAEIRDIIISAKACGAVTTALPVTETIKKMSKGVVERTIDRKDLYTVKTPQAFNYEMILNAHEKAINENFLATDDCSLVERAGNKVHIINADKYNIKITTDVDLLLFKAILEGAK